MSILDVATLARISGVPANDNMRSACEGLATWGAQAGLAPRHRLAHYLAQLLHESTRFRYDREVWGPTKAQKGYEGRADLGNVQPGDGSKFRGYTPGQITGRANTTAFRDWARAQGLNPPDFVADPALMNRDPWEGLGPIWYWDVGNPEGRSLNRYADANDIEMITRRINGGLNGYADRLRCYDRTALIFLGYGPGDIRKLQQDAEIAVDGISGPQTRAAMHGALKALDAASEIDPTSDALRQIIATATSALEARA